MKEGRKEGIYITKTCLVKYSDIFLFLLKTSTVGSNRLNERVPALYVSEEK